MQKIMAKVAAVLTSAVLCAGLVACSSSEDADEGSSETGEAVEEEEEEDDGFLSTVLLEEDEYTITVTGLGQDEEGNYELELSIVNNSESETYEFESYNCAVNGIELSCELDVEVGPGETVESEVVFYAEDLEEQEEMGVEFDFTDVELRLSVYEAEDGDRVLYTLVHFCPYGESEASTFEFEMEDDYETLIDNDSLTVVLVGQGERDDGDYALYLYVENKSDSGIEVYAVDESVNGESATTLGYVDVDAGHAAFGCVYWGDSTLEDLGITDLEDIEAVDFMLCWSGYGYSEEVITLTAEIEESDEGEEADGSEESDDAEELDETEDGEEGENA